MGIDALSVLLVGDSVTHQARAVGATAGVSEVPPGIPEDHVELGDLLTELDATRRGFEASFAAGLEALGLRMAEVAVAAMAADQFPMSPAQLPAAAGGGR